MNENNPNQPPEKKEPEIIVNEYGATRDSAVVIEEENRTVLLTDDETIIIEKPENYDVVPVNRPRKVYAGMWGQAEIATVGLGVLAILAAVLLFIFVVIPSQKQLEANRDKRNELDAELISNRKKYDTMNNAETEAAKLVESVADFQTRFLRPPSIGQTAIYQRINGLINAYGLTNTTGPDYVPLEIAGQQTDNRSGGDAEKGREKFQSLFPGVYITATVEGSYQNLRRFIRELETSDQFIVISTVELEPAEKEDQPNKSATTAQAKINSAEVQPLNEFGVPVGQSVQAAQTQSLPSSARGRTRGQTVNLRIEMAAYFRRADFQPAEPATPIQ